MSMTKIVGVALATAAAGLLAIAPVSMANTQDAQEVACYGVNACKGTGACKSTLNACKGQNSCKGQGITMMSATDCTAKGGSTTAPSAAAPATTAPAATTGDMTGTDTGAAADSTTTGQ